MVKGMKKQFDCVELMHRGAKRIYEDTKGMSRQEELQYWQQQSTRLIPDNGKKVVRRRLFKGAGEQPYPYRTAR